MYVPGHMLHVGCGSVGLIFTCASITSAVTRRRRSQSQQKFFHMNLVVVYGRYLLGHGTPCTVFVTGPTPL